jgi:plasmid stabilization system protein ParE
MVEVKWLPAALSDIERLYSFLHKKNPKAARDAAAAILQAARTLSRFPLSGSRVDDDPSRETFIAFGAGAYVLRYRLDAEHCPVILRVYHSRELR